MAAPLIASLPRDIDLSGDYIIRITALNSSTGAVVSGVNVSNVVITALDVASGTITTFDADSNPLLVPTTEPG